MYLYKYMPLRESFFSEPMLRATPLYVLNDPFEGLFNDNQVKEINASISKVHGQTDYEKSDDYDEEFDLNETRCHLQEEFSNLGILSFTEDYTNPLMWAHYANEHHGIAVELDFTQPLFTNSNKVHDGKICKFGNKTFFGYSEFPKKVRYRREIPSFNRHDIFVPTDKYEYQYKKFQESILLTKSNDWIYEKEHRSVVELSEADRFICNDNKYIRKECAKDPDIEILDLNDNRIQITFPQNYGTGDELGDENIKFEVFALSRYQEASVLHFFRINQKAISSVFFGHRCDYEKALNKIQDNNNLSHLHTFKIKINNFQYQLDAEKINASL